MCEIFRNWYCMQVLHCIPSARSRPTSVVFHAIELGLTRAAYCKTTVQRADFLTKALPVGAFRAAAAFVYPDYEFAKL